MFHAACGLQNPKPNDPHNMWPQNSEPNEPYNCNSACVIQAGVGRRRRRRTNPKPSLCEASDDGGGRRLKRSAVCGGHGTGYLSSMKGSAAAACGWQVTMNGGESLTQRRIPCLVCGTHLDCTVTHQANNQTSCIAIEVHRDRGASLDEEYHAYSDLKRTNPWSTTRRDDNNLAYQLQAASTER